MRKRIDVSAFFYNSNRVHIIGRSNCIDSTIRYDSMAETPAGSFETNPDLGVRLIWEHRQ
jgi:hypothetical protein